MPYFRFCTSVNNTYTTTFPLTENPISESGRWRNGAVNGLDWHDMQTGSGNVYGTAASPSNADDNIACLTGFPANQYVQATVFRAGGYDPTPSVHEIELHVSCTITAHSITSYEFLMNSAGAFQVVRWNGALNDFFTGISVNTFNGGPTAVVDGDVMRVERVGNNFSMYQNAVLKWTWTDGNVTGGAPGVAAFWGSPTNIVAANFGFKDFTAGAM